MQNPCYPLLFPATAIISNIYVVIIIKYRDELDIITEVIHSTNVELVQYMNIHY